MICVSLAALSRDHLVRAVRTIEFAEVRLDTMQLTPDDVRTVFSGHPRLMATMRNRGNDDARADVLQTAIESGAAYVDLDLTDPAPLRSYVLEVAEKHGTHVVISHHDFEQTPPVEELERLLAACQAAGAHTSKLACMVRTPGDGARLVGLHDRDEPLVAIGMGAAGSWTRVASLWAGAPWTYAAPDDGVATAPGQLKVSEIKTALAHGWAG